MGRWKPDARGRLIHAAMELCGQQGYEQTTVAQIAERAGLTERTFFRHFSDKREVMFAGAEALREAMVRAIEGAPSSMPAIDAVAVALEASAAILPERADLARYRQHIIIANPELRERERIKLAALADALAEALRRRGVSDHAAVLAAEMGVAVFRLAFQRWIEENNQRNFKQLLTDSLDELKAVTAGR